MTLTWEKASAACYEAYSPRYHASVFASDLGYLAVVKERKLVGRNREYRPSPYRQFVCRRDAQAWCQNKINELEQMK